MKSWKSGGKPPFPTCEVMIAESYSGSHLNATAETASVSVPPAVAGGLSHPQRPARYRRRY